MDMQDKEFDEVFRSKLEDFESEPAGHVWPAIEQGLNSSNKRKTLLPWLSAAASVVIMATAAGVLVFTRHGAVAHIPVKPVMSQTPGSTNTGLVAANPVHSQGSGTRPNDSRRQDRSGYQTIPGRIIAKNAPANNIDTMPARSGVYKQGDAGLTGNIAHQQITTSKAVVPDKDVQLTASSVTDLALKATPDHIASPVTAMIKTDTAKVKQRHKIHSFGDLVNLVVDKVDKSKDKLIVFSKDDEDDAHITNVNLGAVKTKKGE